MRGRKKKPATLTVLQGNPGKRPVNANEPKPGKRAPSCPSHLDTQAKRIWNKVCKQLLPLGLISEIDEAILALYCQTYSTWLTLTHELKRDGAFIQVPVRDNKGELVRDFNDNVIFEPIKNPRIVEIRLHTAQIKTLAAEIGMTATSRARIQVPMDSDEEDEMKLFMAGKASNAN